MARDGTNPDTSQRNLELFNESYKVTISVDDRLAGNDVPKYWTSDIVALLPEEGVSLETSAKFSAPLSVGAESVNKISQLVGGQSLHVDEMGKNFWDKSEPSSMSLNLKFVTWRDPYDDVVKPSLTLLSLPLPSKSSNNTATAPVLINEEGNLGKGITVDVGPLGILNVLPESVSVDFSGTLCESPSSSRNWPVASEVSFSFKIAQKPTKQSIGNKLLGNG